MSVEGEVIVEVGGLYGRRLAREALEKPQTTYIIVDPQAEPPPDQSVPSNVHYVKAQVERGKVGIPLPDGSADRVVFEQVFGMDYSAGARLWRAFLSEASRILKPGGTLEIIDQVFAKDASISFGARWESFEDISRELEWALPNYGFDEASIRINRFEAKQGSPNTQMAATDPKSFSKPFILTAKKA